MSQKRKFKRRGLKIVPARTTLSAAFKDFKEIDVKDVEDFSGTVHYSILRAGKVKKLHLLRSPRGSLYILTEYSDSRESVVRLWDRKIRGYYFDKNDYRKKEQNQNLKKTKKTGEVRRKRLRVIG